MKKLTTMMLAVILVLATMTALALPTAAITEGDWVTSRGADGYEEGNTNFVPASGYVYTPKGFQTVSADFTNCNPYVQAHTKQSYNLKAANADGKGNAVSVAFTITEYAYNDNNPSVDQWISITLNSQPIVAQGHVKYGSGICILIRGSGDGVATALPHYTDGANGKFSHYATAMINPTLNQEGQEEYTFSIKHDGSSYVMNLCGTELPTNDIVDAILDEQCADGVYVGISLMTSVAETPASFLITEFQGAEVYGEDSADPEPNVKSFAEIAPSETVPEGMPAVLWNGKIEQCDKISISGADYTVQDSGLVTLKNYNVDSYINFVMKNEVSYEASDFPIVAILTKDCMADNSELYFMSGKTMGVNGDYKESVYLDENEYGEGWSLALVDLSYYNEDGWLGRMNALRLDFKGLDLTDQELSTFQVAFFGAFRTVEDAKKYAEDYLVAMLGKMPETDAPTTEAPTTEAPATEPMTETDAATDAPATEQETEAPKSGCGAVVAAPVVALIAMLGVAFVASKKD
jgi:hypothetical protein